MFVSLRRARRRQCALLLASGLLLCALTAWWEELDHHLVSHVRAYLYRYLVNRYDFSSTLAAAPGQQEAGLDAYPYLLNHLDKCGRGNRRQDVLLLLFVKSSPENFERRRAIRETWGNQSFAQAELGAAIRVLFALGVHSDAAEAVGVQAALLREDRAHGDLIQRRFSDTFRNLTTKLMLQLHWGRRYCPQAHFFMSADDDVFVHTPNLLRFLHGQRGARGLWVGHVHRGSPPVRYERSKYHVPEAVYPWPAYPDYTAGGGYVLSADVAAKIYRATLVLNASMYIDDVFLGICGRWVGVSPQDHAFFSGEGKAPDHPCIYGHMITSHGHAADMRALWQAATESSGRHRPGGLVERLYCAAVKVALLCRPQQQSTYACHAAFA